MPGKFILTILLVHIALYTLRGQERTYTHIFSPNNIEEGSWITNGKERKMARASCYVTMQPQEQAEEDDTCFRHTMTYDSKGRLVEIIFINESKRTNYVYDDKDRVIQYSEKYFEEDGETGEEYSEYILHLSITYDPSGKISAVSNKLTESDDVVSFIPKEEKLQIKNKQFEFTDLVYFKNGCIQTVLNIFDYDGDTTYLEKYTYDDKNRVIFSEGVMLEAGQPMGYNKTTTYTKAGKREKVTYNMYSRVLSVEKDSGTITCIYNEKGLLIHQEESSSRGGFMTHDYVYDSNNRVIKETSFIDKELYAIISYSYSK